MVSYKYPGPEGLDPYWNDHIADGTLVRSRSPLPGILRYISEGRKLLLEFQKTMTGQEPRIASILRSKAAKAVDFSIANISVNIDSMETVAKAIELGSVKIELRKTTGAFGAHYSSWVTHKASPRTKGRTGLITVGLGDLATAQGRISVFHESVHALKDIFRYQINKHQDEALAFMAGTLFWRSLNKQLPPHQRSSFEAAGDSAPIYEASNALIDAKNMLAVPGIRLAWQDCEALIKAIKGVSAYR